MEKNICLRLRVFIQMTRINSVLFEKVCLDDYGVFLGLNEFLFDRHLTLIMGAGGTGKTTIMNALSNLGPAEGVEPNFHADSPEMSVSVTINGDRELVKKYASIIFLDSESAITLANTDLEAAFIDVLNDNHRITIKDEVRAIFQTMLEGKPSKMELYKDLTPALMTHGENICLGYAYAFAFRKALNLDLPCVFDDPYGCLDLELRDGVQKFLRQQEYQQILLLSEFKCEDEAHYILDREE